MTQSSPIAFRGAALVADDPQVAPYVLPQAWRIDPPAPVRRVGAWLEAAFCADARVMTPNGPRAVGGLSAGDEILTLDSGAQPLLGVWKHALSQDQVEGWPEARPILLTKGSLGQGAPRRPLQVSPRAGITLEKGLAQAKDLVVAIAARRAPVQAVTYVQLLLPRHSLMVVDGALCESLHPGRLGNDPWDAGLLAQVTHAVPEAAHDLSLYGPDVRPRLRLVR